MTRPHQPAAKRPPQFAVRQLLQLAVVVVARSVVVVDCWPAVVAAHAVATLAVIAAKPLLRNDAAGADC